MQVFARDDEVPWADVSVGKTWWIHEDEAFFDLRFIGRYATIMSECDEVNARDPVTFFGFVIKTDDLLCVIGDDCMTRDQIWWATDIPCTESTTGLTH